MSVRKGRKHTLTAKCAMTGKAKFPGSITKEEQIEMDTCPLCRQPFHPEERRHSTWRGSAFYPFVCGHCAPEHYYDPELEGEDDTEPHAHEFHAIRKG